MKGLGNDRTAGLNSFVRLAELMGAKVYIADGGEINFPEDHPLNYGSTGHMFGASSLPLIQDSDFCLVLGCYLLPEVFPYLGDIFSPDAVVVHVDTNPNNIAKNHRVDHSFVCRPAAFIDQLLVALNTNLNSNYETESRRRMERLCTESPVKHSRVEDTYQFTPPFPSEQYDDRTTYMRSGYFIKSLAEKLPHDHIIFDEALTNSPPVSRLIPGREPGDKMMTRGGSSALDSLVR